MKTGGRYNWKGQKERLIYMGHNFSGNGYWHQFSLVDNPDVIWCEVNTSDLSMIEESKSDTTDSSLPKYEIPYFDNTGWSVETRHGIVWWLWPDERNMDPTLYEEAVKITQKVIETGQPPFGGWR